MEATAVVRACVIKLKGLGLNGDMDYSDYHAGHCGITFGITRRRFVGQEPHAVTKKTWQQSPVPFAGLQPSVHVSGGPSSLKMRALPMKDSIGVFGDFPCN